MCPLLSVFEAPKWPRQAHFITKNYSYKHSLHKALVPILQTFQMRNYCGIQSNYPAPPQRANEHAI